MRHRMTVALLLATLIFTLIASAQQRTASTELKPGDEGGSPLAAEFLRMANEWKDAYNSGDSTKLASMYAEDADYVSPHVATLIAHGRANISANFLWGVKGGGRIDAVEILSSSFSCDMACIVAKYDATNNGQKVSGKWLFATHASIVRD